MSQLHFYLFKNTSQYHRNIWVEIMFRLVGRDQINQLKSWKQFMKLESNKSLLVFNGKDTQIGLGDDNKAVLFNLDNKSNISELNPIMMDLLGDWNSTEILDLQESFKEFLKEKWELDDVESLMKS